MTGRSLFVRLGAAAAVLIVLGLTLAAFGLRAIFDNEIERRATNELTQIVRTVAAQVRIDPDGAPALDVDLPDPRFATPYSGLYWQVSRADGREARSRSLWDDSLKTTDAGSIGERRSVALKGPNGTELLGVTQTILVAPPGLRMWRCMSWPRLTVRISPPRSARSCGCSCSRLRRSV
ncbi:MAG: hypothetical protein R3D69_12765 [Xanthobacteraceae bacterium]